MSKVLPQVKLRSLAPPPPELSTGYTQGLGVHIAEAQAHLGIFGLL